MATPPAIRPLKHSTSIGSSLSQSGVHTHTPAMLPPEDDPETCGSPKLMRGEHLTYWASDHARRMPERDMAIPTHGQPARFCMRQIEDVHILDFAEQLNTSSYVNVVFEPEEEQVALMGLKINLADQTVYPTSFKLHNDVVNMIAKLWNCPCPDDFDETGAYAGAGTVGSTEACLLAGLALKFRWREWYQEKYDLSDAEVRGVYPNLVIGTHFQACWEKFFKYFDVEPRLIAPNSQDFHITGDQVKAAIDDKTIGVVGILGNHYGGHYDPIADIDRAVEEINNAQDFQVGIHVDAASGGFIAPFQPDCEPWDFRLKNVLSISASGHKFGNSCCGTGWIVWRERDCLSEHVAVNVCYLGGSADSYTMNFSRPAQGIYVQYYKFLRLGLDGYRRLCVNQMAVADFIRRQLSDMTVGPQEVSRFLILDDTRKGKPCLPVVTAMLNPAAGLPYDDIDLQHIIYHEHWYVSGYRMQMHHPLTGHTQALFSDQSPEQTMFRIVVKSNLTLAMADHLMRAINAAIRYLDIHGEGYKQNQGLHKRKKSGVLQKQHAAC